jgi:mono/diheme cytochrome c family protein
MIRNLRLASAALALSIGLSTAAQAADPRHGEELARRWCAACHVVAADQLKGGDNVPTFASIAHRPEFNPARLAFFLLDPHPKMPNMDLTRREAEDLAAYIAELGR